jgi:hypothetical protein
MKCPEPSFQWEKFLDSCLEAGRIKELEEHIHTCPACRNRLREAEELRERLSRLPRRITPQRDLWEGINRRIRQEDRAPGKFPVYRLVPLAAAALILLGYLVVSLIQTNSPLSPGGSLVQLISMSGWERNITRCFLDIERKYQKVKEDFLITIEARGDTMDPRFVNIVKTQLDIIDQAVTELQNALEAQPENHNLWMLMARANENRMKILETAQTYLY